MPGAAKYANKSGASTARRLAWGGLSGLLLAASFPPADFGWLSFVALVPLFRALSGATRSEAFVTGWFFATIACCACVSSSISEASSRYFDYGPVVRVLFAFLVPQISAVLYMVLFSLCARRVLSLERSFCSPVLALPALWVASELARATLALGIPWLLLAHAQHALPVLLQIADTTGAYGVSFVVVTVNAIVFELTSRERRAWGPVVVAAALILAVFAYGQHQLRWWNAQRLPQLRVGMVQGAIPLAWRNSVRDLGKSIERMSSLTESIIRREPDLVIWPENAVGFAVAANRSLLQRVTGDLAPGARLLLGAPHSIPQDGRAKFRNSAYLLDGSGTVVERYDKQRLAPFAEYTPWPFSILSGRLSGRTDRYIPGVKPTIFQAGDRGYGVMICYESIYAGLARELVREGATFLVNISNDDWFGNRPALSQHMYATLLRAVENRRTLVRVTNSGISVVIGPTGEIRQRLPTGVAVAAVADVEMVQELSRYTRWGDRFAWACVLVAIVTILVPGQPRRPTAI